MALPALVESLWKALTLGETSPSRREVSDSRGKATLMGTPSEEHANGTGTEERPGIPEKLRADPELFPSKAEVQVRGSGLRLGSDGWWLH